MSNLSWDPTREPARRTTATEPEPEPDPERSVPAQAADAGERRAAAPTPRPAGPVGWGRTPVIVCAALFVLASVLAVVAANRQGALSDERGRLEEVQQTAGRFGAALLTFDHAEFEKSRDVVLSMSTRKFKKEYEQSFPSLKAAVTEFQAKSTGTVTAIYLGELDSDTASAIVVADAISTTKSGTRRTLASYIQLDLVKVGGQWLVDGVTNLNFGQGAGASTTTTAKPTTSTTRRAGRK